MNFLLKKWNRRRLFQRGTQAIAGMGVAAAAMTALSSMPVSPALAATDSEGKAHPELSILAQSTRVGTGDTTDVDFGLTYGGVSVQPTFVAVMVTGYQLTGGTGWWPHSNNTKVDIQVNGDSNTWVAWGVYLG